MRRAGMAALVLSGAVTVSACAGAEIVKSGQLDARSACQAVLDATQAADQAAARAYLDTAVQKAAAAAAENPDYADVDASLNAMLMAVAVDDPVGFSGALDDLAAACDAVDPDPDWSDAVKGLLS
jgi:hypothetical protein